MIDMQTVLNEVTQDQHVCDHKFFPFINRALNEHGYRANIMSVETADDGETFICFTVIPLD